MNETVSTSTRCIACGTEGGDAAENGGVCESCRTSDRWRAVLVHEFGREWRRRHSDKTKHPPEMSAAAFVEASCAAGEAIVTFGPGMGIELLEALELKRALDVGLPAKELSSQTRSDFLEELRRRFEAGGPFGAYIAFWVRRSAENRVADLVELVALLSVDETEQGA